MEEKTSKITLKKIEIICVFWKRFLVETSSLHEMFYIYVYAVIAWNSYIWPTNWDESEHDTHSY